MCVRSQGMRRDHGGAIFSRALRRRKVGVSTGANSWSGRWVPRSVLAFWVLFLASD